MNNVLKDVYGLAENPFSLTTPPDPFGQKWLFVDRSLKEDISSATTLEKAIDKFIQRVGSNLGGNRGLMITGSWGAGKSHSLLKIRDKCSHQGLESLVIDVMNDHEEINSGVSKYNGDLFKAFLDIIAKRQDVQYTSSEDLFKELSADGLIIEIDKTEDLLTDFGSDTYLAFMRSISNLLERWAQQELKMGIVFGMNPEPYDYLKGRAMYVLDRFDKAWISDDISYLEAHEIIESNLSVVKIEEPDFAQGDKKIYPFSKESIHKILDIWRKEIRTIRNFREKCEKVLDSAAEKGLDVISEVDAASAIHSQYNNWEQCLLEWRSQKLKKRVLTYSLYNALDLCKNSSEIRYSDVAVDVPHPVYIDDISGSVKIDLVVIPPNNLPIAIEIETGSSFPAKKYEKIGKLVEQGDFGGVVLLTLSYKGLVRANKVLFSNIKDSNRFRSLKIDVDVLKMGRILSFGTLSPDLNFPLLEKTRDEIKMRIKQDGAVQAIKYSGVQDAIEYISGSSKYSSI